MHLIHATFVRKLSNKDKEFCYIFWLWLNTYTQRDQCRACSQFSCFNLVSIWLANMRERERERGRDKHTISFRTLFILQIHFFPCTKNSFASFFLFSISAGRRKKFDLNKNRNNPSVVHEKFKWKKGRLWVSWIN